MASISLAMKWGSSLESIFKSYVYSALRLQPQIISQSRPIALQIQAHLRVASSIPRLVPIMYITYYRYPQLLRNLAINFSRTYIFLVLKGLSTRLIQSSMPTRLLYISNRLTIKFYITSKGPSLVRRLVVGLAIDISISLSRQFQVATISSSSFENNVEQVYNSSLYT